MKSDIDDIKPDLYKLYPGIKPELIDDLIKIYFEEAKKAIKNFTKPNIALLWGTLDLHTVNAIRETQMLKKILENRNTEINTLTEEQLKKKEIKLNNLLKAVDIKKNMLKNGKTKRSKKRKKDIQS